MGSIHELVVTGGPGGGKTTGLSSIQSWFMNRGFRVFIVPEVATMFFSSGVQDIGKIAAENPELYINVQRRILGMQMAYRKEFLSLAKYFNGPSIIIYDRGPMDGAAYMPLEDFEKMMREENLTLHDVRDSFDGVIHLVTAADGAEEYYTLENNKARRETPEEARALDVRTQNVWCGHPHMKIIDNSTGFDLKMKRMIAAIARIVGIPVPLEIERKFLLASVPDLVHELKNIQIVNIEQVYLGGVYDGQARIRKRVASDGSATYYHTVKTPTNTARVRYEKESRIDAGEYLRLRSFQQEKTAPIEKTRYCFVWKQQYFELDVFHTPSGLVLLEVELTEENDVVDLPHFNILREVTDDPEYMNSTLAGYAYRSIAGLGM